MPRGRLRISRSVASRGEEAPAAVSVASWTNMAILRRLREPGSAASVAAQLDAPRQRIRYHVRELERAGLVTRVAERAHGGLVERLVQASALASADAQHAFATELANAVARIVEEYHDDQAPNGRTFACAVTVHPNVTTIDTGAVQ
jgi:predicted ArsR family transcriptional regulator